MQTFDVVVIGTGPGGYVSAIRAAQLGKKVAVAEKNKVGGTCLNVGCIPSKTYLQYSDTVRKIGQANYWGIETGEPRIHFGKLRERKDDIVKALTGGVQHLLKQNGITVFEGEAAVDKNNTVSIGKEMIEAEEVILATGSTPFVPPISGLEQVDYETTDTLFEMTKLPEKLVIIGGGVIAVELATAMAPLGTEVSLVEVASDILLTEEKDIRKTLKKNLKDMGIEIITAAEIQETKKNAIVLGDRELSFDRLLVAAGRKPNTTIAESLGLDMDRDQGFVTVNEHYQTSKKNIYAIGDLISGYQLAHAASAEGIAAVHTIAGEKDCTVTDESVPRCIYTSPEAASFGLTEKEAAEAGYDVSVSRSDLGANSKAMVMGETEGFLKIVTDRRYQEILGAFMVGEGATEQISNMLAVKHSEGTGHELADVIQPHPSVSEAIGEGANGLFNKAIHI